MPTELDAVLDVLKAAQLPVKANDTSMASGRYEWACLQ